MMTRAAAGGVGLAIMGVAGDADFTGAGRGPGQSGYREARSDRKAVFTAVGARLARVAQ